MKFDWDLNKEKINIQKHGITFEQASYVFADPFALNLILDFYKQNRRHSSERRNPVRHVGNFNFASNNSLDSGIRRNDNHSLYNLRIYDCWAN